ncbi:unnamed protein product [Rotaria magnacalcarata]|uniref:Uncharacterized protein n=1 Tax=Rotaria magnacalcarata TaxID=392030 RepID=A0A816SAR5_9BILA|nr:unnamed protein product [Rotaria magnacalcarata]CAF4122929.1 unnamed protein product [Rotaria magnacalcarata]
MYLTTVKIFVILMVSITNICSIWTDAVPNPAVRSVPRFRPAVPRQQLPTVKKVEILNWAKAQESEYDSTEAMLIKNFTYSPLQYHSTWQGNTVHPLRDAAIYAVALLDSEDNGMEKRAFDVLRKILLLQDTKNDSKTYGIWQYYLEEPLEKMSPPDWNWADFIGTQLLQVVINHHERLPTDLATNMATALIHAARSIQRRNVGPSYTNIAVMGAHVTLAVGEIYNITDLHQYALRRLRMFANYTKENGGFEEYNSPSYTVVVVEELGRLRMHAVVPEAQQLAAELYYIAWKEIIDHYHPSTGQWAGPHSRSYRTILGDGHVRFLKRSMKNELDPRLPLPVPDALKPIFLSNTTIPHTVINTYAKGVPNTRQDLIGTTYLDVSWTVGSINWGEMWNQRRPLVAYWTTKDKTSYFQLRFLHDGNDFSDAQFFSVQKQGQILAGLVLATDGGDKHISLDKIKNATISAADLRLRFEIGGSDATNASVTIPIIANPIKLKFGNMSLQLAMPSIHFDNHSTQYFNVTRGKDHVYIDYILFNGARKNIQLDTLKAAAVIVAAQFSNGESPWSQTMTTLQGDLTQTKWQDLCLAIQTKPSTVAQLRKTVKYGCQ